MPPEQIRRFCNELIALLEPPPSSSNSNSQKQKKKQSQSVDEEAEKKKLAAVGIIDEMSDASSGSESSVAADNTAEDADLDETTGMMLLFCALSLSAAFLLSFLFCFCSLSHLPLSVPSSATFPPLPPSNLELCIRSEILFPL